MHLFTHADGAHLALEGAHIYYETVGPMDAPPLLMLHGGLGHMADLNGIAEPLAAHWRLIGIDLRGHGRSSRGTAALSYARHEADVRAVLDALGVARCAAFGFSDGGIVAYRLAAFTPERVTRLATLGAQWRLRERDPAYELLRGLTPALWREMAPALVADYQRLNPEPDLDALVTAAVGTWTDLGATGYPGNEVERIRASTLIARGDRDELLSFAEAAALRDALPDAGWLNLPWAGHDAHADTPALLLAALTPFLAGDQGPRAS